MRFLGRLFLCGAFLGVSSPSFAAGPVSGATTEDIGKVLFGLVIILIAAKLGGHIMVRLGQPAVLGELIFGIIVGNLHLAGCNWCNFIRESNGIHILAEVGVILLLFQVGLESDLRKMAKVGGSSFLVAVIGIVAPFFIGWGVAAYFLPASSIYVHIFVGTTLCATSVGITARVMLDMGWIRTSEARIILGAAVIDDVLGLVILAVVTGIVKSVAQGTSISSVEILLIILKATLFLACALVLGRLASPRLFGLASRLKAADLLLTTALGLCFAFAYLAAFIGLAPIVGAFAAGLVLDEVHWRRFRERGEHSVDELVKPLVAFLAPIFFVVMGAGVTLTSFAHTDTIGLAITLTLAAVIGKQACSLGVMQKGLDKVSIGIGMVPRGEVGLIFAAIGAKLVVDGQPLIEAKLFSAIVTVVIATTLITPPALKWSISRHSRRVQSADETPTITETDIGDA